MNAQERLAAQVQRTLLARRFYAAEVARKNYNPPLWAESCWTLNGDPSQPYRLTHYPFLREIGMQRAKEVTVMSGAGTGKTEFFFPWALAHAAWGYPFIYGLESDIKTGLLVQERVNPNFRNNPYFQALNKGEADNIKLKKIGRAHGYFLGMGSESVGYSYHAKVVVFDELDRMDPRIVSLVRKRLATAGQPIERYLANPSVPDFGIHERWQRSDQRRWYVKCPHCGKAAPLDWDTHVDEKRVVVACPKCSKAFDRWAAVLGGWWQPTNSNGDHPGYHLHRLMTLVCHLEEMKDELNSSNEIRKATAVRMDRGLPYLERDGGISDSDIKASDAGPIWDERAKGGLMVCDPGAMFDVQIYERPWPNGTLVCCWSGTVADFAELEALADRSGIEWGLIDYMPEMKSTMAFVKRQRSKKQNWWRCAYSTPDSPDAPDWRHDDKNDDLIEANRTGALDFFVHKFRGGKMRYPTRLVSDPKSRLYSHLKSPRRVSEFDRSGRPSVSWKHDPGKPDHQFHCGVYASILAEVRAEGGGVGGSGSASGGW